MTILSCIPNDFFSCKSCRSAKGSANNLIRSDLEGLPRLVQISFSVPTVVYKSRYLLLAPHGVIKYIPKV